jgi:hypothetical protein
VKQRKRSGRMKTPVRAALQPRSRLQNLVQDGLGAAKSDLRAAIDNAAKRFFADSLDLDSALREDHPQENRWDYLLGQASIGRVVAVEVHSANTSEVSVVISKKKAAMTQLRDHLKPGAKVADWIWVASGKVDFYPMDKMVLQLSQEGIAFVGKQITGKNLALIGERR